MIDVSKHLTSYTLEELCELIQELNEPRFRAKQIFEWLHKGAHVFEMSNLPLALRQKLDDIPFGGVHIEKRVISQRDSTIKYLFGLDDGNIVEGVLMRYKYGNTLCISTQVGCNMGCKFCASTINGCVRNLSAGEILSEVLVVERDTIKSENAVRAVTNVVMMGSGEPLDNYDETVRFLHLVSHPSGINISPRNISLSTCGLTNKITHLIDDAPHVTLSLSLHAPNNEIRSAIMPINHIHSINEVINAARLYANKTGRRVIFEYALIHDLNDRECDAKELASRLCSLSCHVNLIPLNSVKERNLEGCTREHAQLFLKWLTELNISATIRREMGSDIDGACGQLRRRVLMEQNTEGGIQ